MFNSKIIWSNEVPILQELVDAGISASEIARKYEVTRQRMSQIFKKYRILPTGKIRAKEQKLAAWNKKWGKKDGSDVYGAQRQKYRLKKAWANRSGIPFTVAFGDIDWPTHCPILGLKLSYFEEKTQEYSPSFDRIDATKGYTPGNVQIISWRANRIKNDGTAEEHKKIAEYLSRIENSSL